MDEFRLALAWLMRVQGGHLPPTEASPPRPALLPTAQPSDARPGEKRRRSPSPANPPVPAQPTPCDQASAELSDLPLAEWPPGLTLIDAWRQQCTLLGLKTPRASLPVWRWRQEDMFRAADKVQSKPFYVSCDKLESSSKATARTGAKVFGAYESATAFATGALSPSLLKCYYEVVRAGTQCKGYLDCEAPAGALAEPDGERLCALAVQAWSEAASRRWPTAAAECPRWLEHLIINGC